MSPEWPSPKEEARQSRGLGRRPVPKGAQKQCSMTPHKRLGPVQTGNRVGAKVESPEDQSGLFISLLCLWRSQQSFSALELCQISMKRCWQKTTPRQGLPSLSWVEFGCKGQTLIPVGALTR
jgi:hypothetical protein